MNLKIFYCHNFSKVIKINLFNEISLIIKIGINIFITYAFVNN